MFLEEHYFLKFTKLSNSAINLSSTLFLLLAANFFKTAPVILISKMFGVTVTPLSTTPLMARGCRHYYQFLELLQVFS